MELNEIINQMQWRAAIKTFDSTKRVSDTDFDKILEIARLTPSSLGLQPWKFVVVNDPEVRNQLQVAAHNQRQVVDASRFVVLCCKNDISTDFVENYIDYVSIVQNVSLEVLADYKQMILSFVGGQKENEMNGWLASQAYIVLGNLLTSCALAGIDACPMEGFDKNKFDEILKLKDLGIKSQIAIAMGYRSDSDEISKRQKVRYPISDLVIEK